MSLLPRVRACAASAIALPLLVFALLVLAGPVAAVHDAGVFELDGDSITGNALTPADDFDSVYLGTDGGYDHAFIDDAPKPDASVHFSGNKDGDSVPSAQRIYLNSGTASQNWQCITKTNVTDKLDLRATYYTAYNVSGDAVAYFGADRDTVAGSANIGFWFFQDRVVCDPSTGTFTGHKRDGDLLIVGPFTGGGSIPGVDVYRWTDPTPGAPESGDEYLALVVTGADCAATGGGDDICGTANGAVFNAAWRPSMPINAFFEGGINLSQVQPNTCYRSLMAETRSSQELSSSLEDFTLSEIFTCASISVEKVTDPDNDPTLFDFEVAGGSLSTPDTFQLKDNAPTHVTLNLQPGNYTVTELALPAGWTLTGAQCRGGSFGTGTVYISGAPFTVALGDKVVCTFVNTAVPTAPPTIAVDKVTIPANHPQTFGFAITGTGGNDSFSLTDADPSHMSSLPAGTYTLTETVPGGWDLTGIVCRGGNFGDGAPYTNGAPIILGAGDKVVCTFTNTLRAPPSPTAITVRKLTIPSSSSQVFGFVTAGGPDALNDAFSLMDTGTHVTSDIKPGSYSVTETVPAGWIPSATCLGGAFGSGGIYSNGSSFQVNAGDQVVCTYTNLNLRPGGQNFCAKSAVKSILNPAATPFKNNTGLDHVVFAHLGESIQTALDLVNDANGDGYVIIGVVAANPVGGTSPYGGHVTQHFEINRAYPRPFALVGCSVTVHDDDRGNGLPTARITAAASNPNVSPANPTFTRQANIFGSSSK